MEENRNIYQRCMLEVKDRLRILKDFYGQKTTGGYLTDLEFCSLQIRKIIELVALSSIAPNKKEYERLRKKMNSDVSRDWHPELIIKDLEKVNPNFWPRAVKQVDANDGRHNFKLEDSKEPTLTKTKLFKIHEKCGKVLHPVNPFGNKNYPENWEELIKEWFELIWNLLSTHTIGLINENEMWLIKMGDIEDDKILIATARRKYKI